MHLTVDNLDSFTQALEGLLKHYEGYVASAEKIGAIHASRQGTWRIRIPAHALHDFLRELMKLGEPQRTSLESQEVTEAYYDLEARCKVAQAEEKRLLQLLDSAVGATRRHLSGRERTQSRAG